MTSADQRPGLAGTEEEILVSPPPDHPLILKREPGVRRPAPPPLARFTLSARGKPAQLPILRFLALEFPHIAIAQVESVFGFVEPCTLYGGRAFVGPELSPRDVAVLAECGVGVRLPLSNHHVRRDEYEGNRPFIERYHRPGNSVITTSDELGRWIRADYPDYEVEASVIKEIDSEEKIDRALEIYHTLVIPMRLNLDIELLERLRPKSRITVFANAGCALTCPSKICYPSFSQANKFTGRPTMCSFGLRPRDLHGMLDFDLGKLAAMGFSRFKMLRAQSHGLTGY